MRDWVLDDGPFGALARNVVPAAAWPARRLHVSEDVAANASHDKSGRRQSWLTFVRPDGESCLVSHSILTGSPVANMIYGHLRAGAAKASRDLGEDESIALCALTLKDALFVTQDKGALYQALAELGVGRVASSFDLWLELRAEHLVTDAKFQKLCKDTARGDAGIAGVPLRARSVPGPIPGARDATTQ